MTRNTGGATKHSYQRASLRRALGGIALLCALEVGAAPVQVTGENLSGRVLSPEERLLITVDRLPEPSEGELRLVVGRTDVTSLLTVEPSSGAAAQLAFSPGVVALPAGTTDVTLYSVSVAGAWEPLARWDVRVAEPSSLDIAEITPSLVIGIEGQVDEGRSGDAVAPRPRTYQDGSLQAGLQTRHANQAIDVSSRWNFVGATRNERTLRFFEKEDAAYNVDLSDFLVELQAGDTRVSFGHVRYGSNSLLLDSFATRGVALSHRLNRRVDLSFSSMNATSVVGFNNFSGLDRGSHRVDAAGIGLELVPDRPGALRAELIYMDASKTSDLNFDVSEVADAETSEGWGVRLLGSTLSGRLTADLAYASSRFFNPDDPFLDFGDEVVATQATRDEARSVHVNYALLQDWALTDTISASFNVDYRHNRADPLYRSLGAFVQADQLQDQFSLSGHIGALNIAADHSRSEDNLDDIPTILKTRSRFTSASLNTSLRQWLASEGGGLYWPDINYSYNHNRQFAANDPAAEESGFNGGSHLPDQVNASHALGLDWSGVAWSLGLQASMADQDNRQVGRENADFVLVDYSVSLGWRPLETLFMGLRWTSGTNEDRESDIERRTRSYGVNVDWQINDNWSLSGNYDTGKDDDSLGQATSRNDAASAQVNWRFELRAFGKVMPGQLFLRYSEQENRSRDNVFDFEADAQTWFLNSGFSLNLF